MVNDSSTSETVDSLAIFSSPKLKGITQDMRELLSQRKLAVLLGAGCSATAGLPLMSELTNQVVASEDLSEETKKIINEVCDSFDHNKTTATIEDYMSEIVDLLSIVTRRKQRKSENLEVTIKGPPINIEQLQSALTEIQLKIADSVGKGNMDLATHREFVQTIHRFLQAGKGERNVDYYVLNYDTLIEDALGLEKIRCFDGFTGSAIGWWDSSVFSSEERGARVYKIHGSIDWCLVEGDFLPRRIRSGIEVNSKRVLIYPVSTKYQEAQRDPFAQLLGQMRQNLCPQENDELVLVTCGYSFSDSHVNLEIENALFQSDGRLTIAAFTSTDKPEGKLKEWKENKCITDQIRVYANKGYFHSGSPIETEEEIPWWRFEVLSKILKGER